MVCWCSAELPFERSSACNCTGGGEAGGDEVGGGGEIGEGGPDLGIKAAAGESGGIPGGGGKKGGKDFCEVRKEGRR